MAATWPITLPQYLRVGQQERRADGRRSSATDTGPGKKWRRTSARAQPVSGTMMMTAAQLAILESFYDDDLDDGALPFEFPAQRGGGTWLVGFVSEQTYSAQMTAPGFYEVSLPLERMP